MKYFLTAAAVVALSGAAQAQSTGWTDGWSGEGSLGAGVTTGNTDTVDIGVGINVAKEFGLYKVTAEGGYEFGQVDGVNNRNRWFVGSQAQREFTKRIYGFGNISYEEDQFSGFDSRLFIGAGAGYHIYKDKPLTWSVEAAPGFRRSVIADTFLIGPPIVTLPGETANDVAVRGASRFAYEFNENVNFTNDTDVIWTQTSTQTINTAAINAKLTKALTARLSFEVRNDTNPPDGFVNTDTATRASIVYGF